MNRLHAPSQSISPRPATKAAWTRVASVCAAALALLLPAVAFAQIPDPDPDPDPDPGPFCADRQFTGKTFQQIIALQGASLDCVNWTRSGNTFAVTVKLRSEHRYASTSESCLYEDGLWTSFSRSINVSSSTPQLFLRSTPTTTQANVTAIAPEIGVRYGFNVRYQEDVGAFSSDFNPMRKKKLCVDLPAPNAGINAGCAKVKGGSDCPSS